MFVNSQPSSINFQKRIIEKEGMTRTQKNLYEDHVKDHVFSDAFTRVSHKLDDCGIDVRVRGVGKDNIEVRLEKNGKAELNSKGLKLSQELAPQMLIRQLEDKFLKFKEKCLIQVEREKNNCVDELMSSTEIFPDYLDDDF